MTTFPCPACDRPVLVVMESRWGGQMVAFDPEPGTGAHFDTLLGPRLAYVADKTGRLQGRGLLYRRHLWTCPQGLKVDARQTLPGWDGYTHKGG